MCMNCHGAVGHDQGKTQVLSPQCHCPGHHTWLPAAAFMPVTPGCAFRSSLRICSRKEGGMMVHIRQPCSTEISPLQRKNGLHSWVVQKWTGQPFWAIARAFDRTGFLAVWHAISKTETGCLHNCTTVTWKILSWTLASFLYCRGSLDKAAELVTSAEGLNLILYWYE